MDVLNALRDGHRLISAHRCRCGWEGDDAITHVIDLLELVETPDSANNAMVKYETPWMQKGT